MDQKQLARVVIAAARDTALVDGCKAWIHLVIANCMEAGVRLGARELSAQLVALHRKGLIRLVACDLPSEHAKEHLQASELRWMRCVAHYVQVPAGAGYEY